MKKLLLSLVTLLSLVANAQQYSIAELNMADRQEATFDFSNPLSLNPSITPASQSGMYVDVTDNTFKQDSISLSFNKTTSTMGALIGTFYSNLHQSFSYWFELNSNTQMLFNGNECALDSIAFLDNPDLSGITTAADQHGTFYNQDKCWKADVNNYRNSVILVNNSTHYARLYKVKVYYYLPFAQFVPTTDILTTDLIHSFSELKLTFSENVTYKSSADFKITYKGEELGYTVTVNGKVVTIKLNKEVSDDGDLVIHIPAGCFVASKGYYNKELNYTYPIVKKRDTFEPVSYSPENNSDVDALASGDISITFDGAISDFSSDIRFALFKEGKSDPVCLLKPVRGANNYTIKLEFDEATSDAIDLSGSYSITIPAKTFYHFKDTEYESWNPELKLSYNVVGKDRLVPTVSPENAAEVEKFYGLTLTFDDNITYTANEDFTITFNGEKVDYTVSVQNNVVTVSLPKRIAEDGQVKVHIPSFCFANAAGYANKTLDYTYTVKPVITPEIQEAKRLLGLSGVGYPKTSTATYQALNNLLENDATDAQLAAAITALYNETDVLLPDNEQYFKISCVNSNGKTLYVGYDYSKVFISGDADDAAVFTTSREADKIVFRTMDGKYLHVLTGIDDYVPTSSSSCINESKSDVNKLEMSKLISADKPKEAYGLLTMRGLLGKDELGHDKKTYAVLNFEDNAMVKAIADEPFFYENDNKSGKFSSGFKLIETEKTDGYVKLEPSLECERKKIGDSYTNILTLTFDKNKNVKLNADPALVDIRKNDSETVEQFEVFSTAESGVFTINIGDKPAGSYVLTAPEKTFISKVGGEDRYVKEFSKLFKIKDILDVDFTTRDAFFYYLKEYTPSGSYMSEDLNDFGFYINKKDKFEGLGFKGIYNDTTMNSISRVTYLSAEKKQRYQQRTEYVNSIFASGQWPQSIDSIIVDDMLYKMVPYYASRDLAPSNKTVKLRSSTSHSVIRTGRFVRYNTGDPDILAIKIEFDQGPIAPKELSESAYVFIVEEGTFGDANFAKYLSDQNSIEPKRCIVNPGFISTIYVDNKGASDIREVNAVNVKVNGIFDLMGRKVQDMKRPGIYIVNGKKVVVK